MLFWFIPDRSQKCSPQWGFDTGLSWRGGYSIWSISSLNLASVKRIQKLLWSASRAACVYLFVLFHFPDQSECCISCNCMFCQFWLNTFASLNSILVLAWRQGCGICAAVQVPLATLSQFGSALSGQGQTEGEKTAGWKGQAWRKLPGLRILRLEMYFKLTVSFSIRKEDLLTRQNVLWQKS